MGRIVRRLKRATKRAANSAVGAGAIGLLKLLRQTNPDTMRNIAGWFMRTVGPLLPENRIGRANLTAAFPEKSTTEIDTILRGVWTTSAVSPLSSLTSTALRISIPGIQSDRAVSKLRGGPGSFLNCWSSQSRRSSWCTFGNWELPAVCAAACKIDTAVLYRRPNNPRSTNGCMRHGLRRWECLSRPVPHAQ